MRNKGFTLIELLGVIVILALLMILTFPSIINLIKSSSNEKDDLVIDLVYSATESLIKDNRNYYPDITGNSYCIPLADLIEHGDLKGPVNINNEDITDKKSVQVTYSDRYNYELKDNDKCITKIQPNKPDLLNGSLTPIKYNGSNWVVVDGTKTDWYNYETQEWANAVILNEGVTKSIGNTVNVASEVKAMFVWIPKYEYKIEGIYGKGGTSTTSPGEIEVRFVSKNKTKPSNDYIMHPAFTFGTEQLSGIWVGKFETTGTGDNPTILPNVASLRSQVVSVQFATAQKFNSFITGGDSHMMKNSEWGAAAYLSQSKYGKYGNSKYTGAEKQVRINNCSNFITGIGADSQNASASTNTCTTNTYTTEKGQTASTTGNITGIYDMSGGSFEYVMGSLKDVVQNSGFSSYPNAKYFDAYTSINPSSNDGTLSATACNSGVCYGHGLSETKNWYGDAAGFVNSNNSWFRRGGYNNPLESGVFASNTGNGSNGSNNSFRVVVS